MRRSKGEGKSRRRAAALRDATRERSPSLDLSRRLALRPAEAARALGLSERTLRANLRELPHVRVRGCVLLPVDGLRAWLGERAKAEQRRVDAAVEEGLRFLGMDD